ncbi:MAG: caspase family protein [Cyanobacteria bacterium P01_A01_bin.123]
MIKHALLIGVSQYQPELSPLPGTADDIKAMRGVLSHPEMGGFDEVQTLLNPEPMAMQEAIELFFSNCKKNDLALLFFSGHGIKDDQGRLYFSTPKTRKSEKGELIRATAVPAGFVQDVMSNSRCKRQVVILDCCFSGAFAEGMTAKESGSVDISAQLGGEGRAVLTSSSSTQYSFEQAGAKGSVYTRYVVEGIETGAADTDDDGFVSVDELHEYARKKVQAAAPAMRPKIYAVEEGFKIHVARATVDDPYLKYRKEADKLATRGEFSVVGRFTLDTLQTELGIKVQEATQIETEVLKPYREYQQRLKNYEDALHQTLQSNQSLTDSDREELKLLRQVLDLEEADVDSIEAKLMSATERMAASNRLMASLKTVRSRQQDEDEASQPNQSDIPNATEEAPLEDLLSSFKQAIKREPVETEAVSGEAAQWSTSRRSAKPLQSAMRSPEPAASLMSSYQTALETPTENREHTGRSKQPNHLVPQADGGTRQGNSHQLPALPTEQPKLEQQSHFAPQTNGVSPQGVYYHAVTVPKDPSKLWLLLAGGGVGIAIALTIFASFAIFNRSAPAPVYYEYEAPEGIDDDPWPEQEDSPSYPPYPPYPPPPRP